MATIPPKTTTTSSIQQKLLASKASTPMPSSIQSASKPTPKGSDIQSAIMATAKKPTPTASAIQSAIMAKAVESAPTSAVKTTSSVQEKIIASSTPTQTTSSVQSNVIASWPEASPPLGSSVQKTLVEEHGAQTTSMVQDNLPNKGVSMSQVQLGIMDAAKPSVATASSIQEAISDWKDSPSTPQQRPSLSEVQRAIIGNYRVSKSSRVSTQGKGKVADQTPKTGKKPCMCATDPACCSKRGQKTLKTLLGNHRAARETSQMATAALRKMTRKQRRLANKANTVAGAANANRNSVNQAMDASGGGSSSGSDYGSENAYNQNQMLVLTGGDSGGGDDTPDPCTDLIDKAILLCGQIHSSPEEFYGATWVDIGTIYWHGNAGPRIVELYTELEGMRQQVADLLMDAIDLGCGEITVSEGFAECLPQGFSD